MDTLERDIRSVTDTDLWQFRLAASKSLVTYTRKRLARQLAATGASIEVVTQAGHLLDPQCIDPGVCPTFCHVQKTEPAATRPGEIYCAC